MWLGGMRSWTPGGRPGPRAQRAASGAGRWGRGCAPHLQHLLGADARQLLLLHLVPALQREQQQRLQVGVQVGVEAGQRLLEVADPLDHLVEAGLDPAGLGVGLALGRRGGGSGTSGGRRLGCRPHSCIGWGCPGYRTRSSRCWVRLCWRRLWWGRLCWGRLCWRRLWSWGRRWRRLGLQRDQRHQVASGGGRRVLCCHPGRRAGAGQEAEAGHLGCFTRGASLVSRCVAPGARVAQRPAHAEHNTIGLGHNDALIGANLLRGMQPRVGRWALQARRGFAAIQRRSLGSSASGALPLRVPNRRARTCRLCERLHPNPIERGQRNARAQSSKAMFPAALCAGASSCAPPRATCCAVAAEPPGAAAQREPGGWVNRVRCFASSRGALAAGRPLQAGCGPGASRGRPSRQVPELTLRSGTAAALPGLLQRHSAAAQPWTPCTRGHRFALRPRQEPPPASLQLSWLCGVLRWAQVPGPAACRQGRADLQGALLATACLRLPACDCLPATACLRLPACDCLPVTACLRLPACDCLLCKPCRPCRPAAQHRRACCSGADAVGRAPALLAAPALCAHRLRLGMALLKSLLEMGQPSAQLKGYMHASAASRSLPPLLEPRVYASGTSISPLLICARAGGGGRVTPALRWSLRRSSLQLRPAAAQRLHSSSEAAAATAAAATAAPGAAAAADEPAATADEPAAAAAAAAGARPGRRGHALPAAPRRGPARHLRGCLRTLSMISDGWQWSTVQPTDTAVPSISLQVPPKSLAQLLGFMTRAISMMSSNEMLPVCLMFFSCGRQRARGAGGCGCSAITPHRAGCCCGRPDPRGRGRRRRGRRGGAALTFFLSLGGSLRALMTRAAAEGTTETFAWRFCTVSLTVTRRPFQSFAVSLAMSSPIFLGDRPRGPICAAAGGGSGRAVGPLAQRARLRPGAARAWRGAPWERATRRRRLRHRSRARRPPPPRWDRTWAACWRCPSREDCAMGCRRGLPLARARRQVAGGEPGAVQPARDAPASP